MGEVVNPSEALNTAATVMNTDILVPNMVRGVRKSKLNIPFIPIILNPSDLLEFNSFDHNDLEHCLFAYPIHRHILEYLNFL